MRTDLNQIPLPGHEPTQRRGASSAKTTVHFGDVASAAEEFIESSEMLVGCVAWVRSPRLVAALARRPVALVVNKEFGLRVDGHPERKPLLLLNGGVPGKVIGQTGKLEAARCAGHTVRGKFGALMHHKFLVRLSKTGRPLAVWTGSFNLTSGAERNIENGMVITDTVIAKAFLEEFSRVYALSEPLLFAAGTPKPGGGKGGELRIPAPKRKRKKAVRKRKPAAGASKPTARKRTTAKRTKK